MRYICDVYRIQGIKRSFLYFLRSIIYYKQTTALWNYIDNNEFIRGNYQIIAEVLKKVHRPFLRPKYSVKERIEIISNHFDFIIDHFPAELCFEILGNREVVITKIQGKGSAYFLTMSRQNKFNAEGELVIELRKEDDNNELATISFIFSYNEEDKPIIIIGVIQGPPNLTSSENNKQKIIAATRDLSGLRPKSLVLETLCSIARSLGIEKIYAPSNSTHISTILPAHKQRIYSNYNSFWEELGGIKLENGDYLIPSQLHKRDITEVATKKRQQWLIKMEHLNFVYSSVAQLFL